MHEFYEPEVLKKLQDTELSMLKDFMELCDSHGLLYFGIGGTGIGALRHQGFIPWDDDIDIAMPRRDFEKFLRLAKKKWQGKYYILNNKTNENYPMMTTRLCKCGTVFQENVMRDVDCPFGIFLDLYVMDNIADGKLALQVQRLDGVVLEQASCALLYGKAVSGSEGHEGRGYLGRLPRCPRPYPGTASPSGAVSRPLRGGLPEIRGEKDEAHGVSAGHEPVLECCE